MRVISLWFILKFMIVWSEGEQECQNALGMESGDIPNQKITASSQFDANHAPNQGRLHFQATAYLAGCWSSSVLDTNQWFQVDLGQHFNVTRVATQGRNGHTQWVSKYKLQYSNDGVNFPYYTDDQGQTKEFAGNTDSDTIVTYELNPPIWARYIRFQPVTWQEHISMRAELYGCIRECQKALGMQDGAITSGQLSASSEWDPNTHDVTFGRLFYNSGSGSWAALTNDANQWFQVDLISQSTKVTRVATQGRSIHCCQWVTKYKLQYGNNGVNFTYYKEQGNTTDKEFTGNTDQDSVVFHDLKPPIRARYVRLRPVTWRSHISMRMELYGCMPECQEPLGMENGLISDGQLSVSSQWSALHGATRARLHIKSPPACWAALRKDANQWLQIDVLGLDRKYTKVTRVATQGRYDCCDQWVTKYKLQYSNDGKNFQYYKEQGQNTDKEFAGNIDRDTIVHHELNPPITARYIRFRPLAWYRHISMRVELYGCTQECTSPAVGMKTGEILDSQITASSHNDQYTRPSLARIKGPSAGVWCPKTASNEYIQVDLGRLFRVCAVATQGNPTVNRDHVKEYKLEWSNDNANWETSPEVLAGNTNWRDVVKNSIPVIYARYIRLFPLKWHVWPCTRMELYGEPWPNGADALFTPIGSGKALAGHVISSLNATDVTQCMKLCLVTEQCKSFNFSEQQKRCEVSNSTTEAKSLKDQEGFNYYERATFQAISL